MSNDENPREILVMFVVKNKNPKDVIPPKIKQKIVLEYCTFLKRVMISLGEGGKLLQDPICNLHKMIELQF